MKHREESDANHERWLVSYADFITLMFAFFAVLYATSEKDLSKSKEFEESVKKYLIKAGAFGESGQQINQGETNNAVIEPPIQTFRPSKPETVKALAATETFIEEKFTAEERKRYIMDISTDEWGVRVMLEADQIFASGSDKFKPEAAQFIGRLSGLMRELNRKILIEGHAAKGETGMRSSTWDFASSRAINVLRFLQATQKLDPKAMASATFGDSRPLFEGPQANLNSRIELVLLHEDVDL
ncbi:MAG: flagellar motor protein MotB [Bdellovibrionales bacterium]